MDTLAAGKDLLFTLLLKVGVAASLAALLVRWSAFRKVLYTEIRDSDLKLKLMLFLTPALALGVVMRLVAGYPYRFADLMLEGAFILGLLGGRVVGPLGGSLVSLPAFFNHEWLSMPMAAFAGLLGGLIRQAIPNKEDIWNLGPFTFLSIPRWLSRLGRKISVPWEVLPLTGCVLLELVRLTIHHAYPRWLFAIPAYNWWSLCLVLLATLMAVAVPIKIWNNTRIQMNLEQYQQLLLKARLSALSSQINPHFLFNTLNTVSSLVRYDPDLAREMILKLSNILRRLLRKHEAFVPLHEELAFVDDYLDIEVARFGRDNLQIFKEVDPGTLEAFVPSMLLQPIVENSIKHGLAAKLEGGHITIRTSAAESRLILEIEDNGVGISEERMARVFLDGIGISNVQERLRVLYGADFRLDINSREGEGTRIRIEVPELVSALPGVG